MIETFTMESIILEDVNDAIKREKLFKKVCLKVLQQISYDKPQNCTELLRTKKELDDLEKEYVQVDKKIKKKKNRDEIELDIEEDSCVMEPEISNKERRIKNKKKFPISKGKRRKEIKSKKKANRRKRR